MNHNDNNPMFRYRHRTLLSFLVLAFFIMITTTLILNRGRISAEIPMDQGPDPWPLSTNSCDLPVKDRS